MKESLSSIGIDRFIDSSSTNPHINASSEPRLAMSCSYPRFITYLSSLAARRPSPWARLQALKAEATGALSRVNGTDGIASRSRYVEIKSCRFGEPRAGDGLFSTADILAGTRMLRLVGDTKPFPTRTSVQISAVEHVEDPYGVHFNHSFTPNCVVHGREVHALRNIRQGEHLTYDYTANEDRIVCPFKTRSGIMVQKEALFDVAAKSIRNLVDKYSTGPDDELRDVATYWERRFLDGTESTSPAPLENPARFKDLGDHMVDMTLKATEIELDAAIRTAIYDHDRHVKQELQGGVPPSSTYGTKPGHS